MPPTLKPIHEMDETHLINTVNKIGMDIERRRACLLELWRRDKYINYIFGPGSIISNVPAHAYWTYASRFFLDNNWENTNYDKYIYIKAKLKKLEDSGKYSRDYLINKMRFYFINAIEIAQQEIEREVNLLISRLHELSTTVAEKPIKEIKTKQQTKEQTMPRTIKDTAIATLAQNKQTFTVAAQVTAGRTVNQQLIKAIKPKMPMMLRGYSDHPIASILLANATAFAIKQYMPTNNKANILADCMMQAAAIDTMDSFNIEDMVNDFISNLSLPAGIFGEEEEKTIPAPKGRTRDKAKTE